MAVLGERGFYEERRVERMGEDWVKGVNEWGGREWDRVGEVGVRLGGGRMIESYVGEIGGSMGEVDGVEKRSFEEFEGWVCGWWVKIREGGVDELGKGEIVNGG